MYQCMMTCDTQILNENNHIALHQTIISYVYIPIILEYPQLLMHEAFLCRNIEVPPHALNAAVYFFIII